jgi:tetratricopeptide (TPR) repeat protein
MILFIGVILAYNVRKKWVFIICALALLVESVALYNRINNQPPSKNEFQVELKKNNDAIVARLVEESVNLSRPAEMKTLIDVAEQFGYTPNELILELQKGPILSQAVSAYLKMDYDTAAKLLNENVPHKIYDLSNSWFYLGNINSLKKQWKDAIKYYKKVIEIEPKAFSAMRYLAEVYIKINDFNSAVGYLEKAIELNPEKGEPYINLGYVFNRLGKYDEAILLLEKGARLNPANLSYAYSNLGVAMKGLKKYSEAKNYFDKALSLNPSSEEISIIYVNLGNLASGDKAIQYFKRAVDVYPENAMAYYNWGTLLMNMDILDEAEQKFRLSLEFDPYLAEAYHNLGNVLLRKKDLKETENYDEEEVFLRKANGLKPDNAEILYSLGEVLRLQKKDAEAIMAYRKSIELNPRYKIGAYAPSRYYEELRDW